MIKFKAIISGPAIERREVYFESKDYVRFYDPIKGIEFKFGNDAQWFDTWAEAHEWLKERAVIKLEETKAARIQAEQYMDKILDMIPPES